MAQASESPLINTETQQASVLEGLVVKTFPVGPLRCNCTVIGDPQTGEALVVDPGGDVDVIEQCLADNGLTTVHTILHTHAHFDHFMASGHLQARTGAKLGLHPDDRFLWDALPMQCERFDLDFDPVPPPDFNLDHEAPLAVGGLGGTCLHTPGHTPGSMCFHFPDLQLLLGGDTLFKGSIGRTDLWGGDFDTIERSIRERLYTLDEATKVITGHGPATTIGDEVRYNSILPGIRS